MTDFIEGLDSETRIWPELPASALQAVAHALSAIDIWQDALGVALTMSAQALGNNARDSGCPIKGPHLSQREAVHPRLVHRLLLSVCRIPPDAGQARPADSE